MDPKTQIPFDFETSGFQFVPLGWEFLPLHTGKLTDIQQRMPFDDEGVAVRDIGGRYYDHPVRQAQFLISRLDQYTINGDEAYMDLCVRHAERLRSKSIESNGGAFLPYEFPWNLHRFADAPMDIPWFSGMAQGYGLSAFCRMYQVTGVEYYLDFAHQLFRTFLIMREQGRPWIVDLEQDHYLWFEEYPRDNGPSDRAFNGHLYAIYGLYDYWAATNDERAVLLADGGFTSVLALLDKWRFPGGQSFYCLTHRERTASYHATHCGQLNDAYNMTGEPVWLQLQDLFVDDYPVQVYAEKGRDHLVVMPGTYEIAVGDGLEPQSYESVTIDSTKHLEFDIRGKLRGETFVSVRVNVEPFKFRWFPQVSESIYVEGLSEQFKWAHERKLLLQDKRIDVEFFDETGTVTGERQINGHDYPVVHANERALIRGTVKYRLADTNLAGGWISRNDVKGDVSAGP